ncbi:MAG: WXG100 family type VII secretion target [Bulleidia sp.]
MRHITVEPEQLELIAGRMEGENDEFTRYYNELFSLVDRLSSSWQGSDSLAFCNQIAGYQDDCRQLSQLCTSYTEFLRHTARGYREVQDELCAEAMRLVS